ncbi:MAG: hypothetical protein V2A71_04290 [Candidatus Eisenbacteria bacterium]
MGHEANKRRRGTTDGGQSLTELIIVIVIVGIVSLVFGRIFVEAARSYEETDKLEGILQNCRMAAERMSKEMRGIKDRTSYKETAQRSLYFRTMAGDSVRFSWDGTSGGELVFQRNLVSSVLTARVDSLGFSYFDSTGSAAPSPETIWRIGFTLRLKDGDKNTQMRSSVYVRNH